MNLINQNIQGFLLGFIGYSLFTVGDALIKHLAESYSVFTLNLIVAIFLQILLLIFSQKLGGYQKTFFGPKTHIQLIRALLMGFTALCVFYSFSQLPLATAYTIFFLSPFVSSITAAILLKEHIPIYRIALMVFGFLGVLIVLRPGLIPLSSGAIAALVVPFTIGISHVLMKYIGPEQTKLSAPFYQSLGALVVSAYPAYLYFSMPTLLDLGLIFLVAAFGMTGILFVAQGYLKAPASFVASTHYTQIIWGVLWGYLFFSELPDIWVFVGAAVIIGSGLFKIYWEYRLEKK